MSEGNAEKPLFMPVPQAGAHYYGLSRGGSYDAVRRGEIVALRVGRLLKVPVAQMEAKFGQAGAVAPRRHKS
jgi:hypothetical protein